MSSHVSESAQAVLSAMSFMDVIGTEVPPVHPRLQRMVRRTEIRIRRASNNAIHAMRACGRSKTAQAAYAPVVMKAKAKKMRMRHQAKKLEGK